LELTPILVVVMASLAFTGTALLPWITLKGRRGLKKPTVVFFLASFFFSLLLLWLGFLSAGL